MAKQQDNNSMLWIGVIVVIIILVGGYFLLKGGKSSGTTTAPYSNVTTTVGSGTTVNATTTIAAGNKSTTTIQTIQPGVPLNITETEWAITPSVLTITHGQNIVLHVWNKGTVGHNLQITSVGSTPEIAPGGEYTLNFTAPAPGNYSMIDSDPGYVGYGMSGTLLVK